MGDDLNLDEFEKIWWESERAACREDPIRFINRWLWIEEPQKEFNEDGPGWKPFKLWKAQERILKELIEAYEKNEWRVMFKARGVGGTYVVLAFYFWLWWSTPNFIGLLGSRKAEEVDYAGGKKRTTLFAKLDGFIEHLPPQLLPEGFDRNCRQNMLLINPENGSYFTGESANANFGHSNRGTAVLIDEYARWAYPVFWSVLGVTSFTVAISTLNDNVDHFTDLIDKAAEAGRLITYKMEESENYTPEWRMKKEAATDPLTWAREYLMDRTASTAGRVYAAFNRNRNVGHFPYNPDLPLAIFWDWGYSDETYMGFLQKDFDTGDLYVVNEVCVNEQKIKWFLNFYPRVKLFPNPFFIPDKFQQAHAYAQIMRRPVIDFGDPSGRNRTQLEGGSIFQTLKEFGIRPKCNLIRWQVMKDRVASVRNLLDRLHVDESCEWLIKSMEAYKYPERDQYAETTSSNDKPAHNWASHACTALEAFAISEDMWKDDQTYRELVAHAGNPFRVRSL